MVGGVVFAGTVALLAVAECLGASGTLPLAGCNVVVPDGYFAKNERWGMASARDLTNALLKATGVPSALLKESESRNSQVPTIFVGPTKAAAAAGIDVAKIARGDAVICVERNRAFIASAGHEGTSGGVVEFLQKVVDCWFTTVDGVDPVPRNPDLAAAVGEFRYAPVYRYKHFLGGSRYPDTINGLIKADYARRVRGPDVILRANKEMDDWSLRPGVGVTGHSYYFYLWPNEYFKDHPEWYSLGADGKRHAVRNSDSQLCLSNPELLEQITTNMFKYIERDIARYGDRHPTVYDFSQNDCSSYLCKCENCRRIVAKYNRKPGGNAEGGDAGLQLEFVNALARRVRAKFPDIKIRTFAYVSTDMPPVGIVPEENVIIWLCDLYSESCHYLPLTHPFNRKRLEVFMGWAAISKHMEIWDYWIEQTGAIVPYPEIHVDSMAADMKLFADHGVRRFFSESGYFGQCFYELNNFVQAQCYVHPDSDVDVLVEKHCRVFGSAAKEMKVAIDFLRKLELDNPPESFAGWHMRALPWRTLANWRKFRNLCEQAMAKADTDAAKCRIAAVLAATSAELMSIAKGRNGCESEYAKAKADFAKYSKMELEGMPMAPSDRERVKEKRDLFLVLADMSFKDLPPELAKEDTKNLLCFEGHTFYAKRGWTKVDAPDSETGKAYRRGPIPEVGSKPPYNCLLRDAAQMKANTCKMVLNPIADGKYHWYRLAYCRMGQGARFFVAPDTYLSVWLSDYYIPCDGLDKDPNFCEVWVSAKYCGEPTDDPATGLFVDRIVLRRVPRPIAK